MQLCSLTWKTLGPLLTNSAWCRQCGKPFTQPLQKLYREKRSTRGWKREKEKVCPCPPPFSLSLSSSFPPPFIPTATLSSRSHWCMPRHPFPEIFFFLAETNNAIVFLKPVLFVSYYVQSAQYELAATVLQRCNLYLFSSCFGCPPWEFLLFLIPFCCYTEACVSVCLLPPTKHLFCEGGLLWPPIEDRGCPPS